MRVFRIPRPAIAVQVQSCLPSGIGPQCEDVRIVDKVCQRTQGLQLKVIVDPLQQQNIGTCFANDLRDRQNLSVFSTQDITQQKPRPIAPELNIPCGNPVGLGPGRKAQAEDDQAGDNPASPAARSLA